MLALLLLRGITTLIDDAHACVKEHVS